MTTGEIDEAALSSWLEETGWGLAGLERLPGDVSPRRYARVVMADGGRAVVAWYADEIRDVCRRFELTTALLHDAAIAVPRILAADCERGFMLLEDAGRRTLFDLRRRPLAERLPYFEDAVAIARRIAVLPVAPIARLNPPLDTGLLNHELEQTVEVFLAPRALLGTAGTRRTIESALGALCEALGRQQPVPCHRDFMSRNLVPRAEGCLMVLDHQDLRLGPPGYDLASLLNDSFYPTPRITARLIGDLPPGGVEGRAFHRAAAQRALKAVGTFARFAALGSDRHLPLIPATLTRALHHLARTPEGAPLASTLEKLWEPVVGDRAGRARTD